MNDPNTKYENSKLHHIHAVRSNNFSAIVYFDSSNYLKYLALIKQNTRLNAVCLEVFFFWKKKRLHVQSGGKLIASTCLI